MTSRDHVRTRWWDYASRVWQPTRIKPSFKVCLNLLPKMDPIS